MTRDELNDVERDLLTEAGRWPERPVAVHPRYDDDSGTAAILNLLRRKMLREVGVRGDLPVWRRDSKTGKALALRLTTAGQALAAKVRAERFCSTVVGEVSVRLPEGGAGMQVAPPSGQTNTLHGKRRGHRRTSGRQPETSAVISDPSTAATSSDRSKDASDEEDNRQASEGPTTPSVALSTPSTRPRSTTTILIDCLTCERGASIDEIMTVTGWLAHSTRAALTGLRKRGHAIDRFRDEGNVTRYRIIAPATASQATEAVAATTGDAECSSEKQNAPTPANPIDVSTSPVHRESRRAEVGDAAQSGKSDTVVLVETPKSGLKQAKARIRREHAKDARIVTRGAP